MRLIDADALKQSVDECNVCNVCPERKARCNYDCEFPDHLTPKFEALIDAQPTIEPKRGEWEEKETFHNGDDEPIIEEWQSALCSVCHKYHTTPYMYYFNNYNFCPNCGSAMTKE